MKNPKATLIALSIVIAVAASLVGCTPKTTTTTPSTQIVTVERGNISMDIIGVGNLALSKTADLAFDISGTVAEVLVEIGDTVSAGQVLVTLDAEEWADELSTLEDAVTQAKRTVTQKEVAVTQQEINVLNAENDVEDAKDAWLESTSAGRKVALLQNRLDWYEENDPDNIDKIKEIEDDLKYAWNTFNAVATSPEEVTAKEKALTIAQANLEDARLAIEDAGRDLETAEKKLDEANEKSIEVTAPFDGFVTRVNVEGGDEVLKGTVAVQIADPAQYEASIMVSENDIFDVQPGSVATLQVDALPGISLPAKVTSISPTATIQSGVVTYEVKVEVEPLGPAATTGTVQSFTNTGTAPQTRPTSQAVQLKEGLTVTVDIIIQQSLDVLMVPSQAIMRTGGESSVQVVKDYGTTEQRTIKTGVTDYTYTEVTEGLSEGEKVLVTNSSSSSTSSTSGTRRSDVMFFEGGGPPPNR